VLHEAGDDLRQRHPGDLGSSDLRTGVDEDFEPQTEPRRVELFIQARRRRAPEIDVEDVRQLRRSRLCNEIDAVFKTVSVNDAMQLLRPQLRCKRGESLNELVWQAVECRRSRGSQPDCFLLDTHRTIEMGARRPAYLPFRAGDRTPAR
jgi:hypothetical protein